MLGLGVDKQGEMGDEQREETTTLTGSATSGYETWKARMEGSSRHLTRNMAILNVLGFLAHCGGVVYVVASAGDRISMKVELVQLEVVRTSDTLQSSGNATTIWSGQSVHAYFVYVAWCVMGIHAISMAFHAAIAATLVVSLWVPAAADGYLRGLYVCRAPWRWLEYAFSATLMIFLTVVLMGVRDVTSVYSISSLCFVTQLFGWLTEVHSSTLIDRSRGVESRKALFGVAGPVYDFHYRWRPGSRRNRLLWHHLMGYVPFFVMWWLVLDTFYKFRNGLGDLYPPFMDLVVWGSIFFFSLFGVTQFLQQLDDFGPSWYPAGEASYVALSFMAKVWLGVVITQQMIARGAKWDASVGATF